MSDFLGRLADRTLGVAQVARPILPSAYASQPDPGSSGFVETHEFVDDERLMDDIDRRGVAGAAHPAEMATATEASRGARPIASAQTRRQVSGKSGHADEAVRTGATQRGNARTQVAATRVVPPPADEARPAAARRDGVGATSAIVAAEAPTRVPLGRRRRVTADSVAAVGPGPAAENLLLAATSDVGPHGRFGSPVPAAEATVLRRATPSSTRRPHGDLVVAAVGASTSVPVGAGSALPALRQSVDQRRSVGEASAEDAAPTITVTIGRVEVRSPTPPAPPQPPTPPWKPPHLSLDEFLARRPDR